MKFKILKPFVDVETKEEYEAEQIVEMTVARALTAAEKLAAYGGRFIEVVEEENTTITIPSINLDGAIIADAVAPLKAPSDLTVAELKVELEKLGIDYPSDAKKAELLALFEGKDGEE